MFRSKRFVVAFSITVFVAGALVGNMVQPWSTVSAQGKNRTFELRYYTAKPGQLDAVQSRFRNYTIPFFNKYGIAVIGYWVPQDAPQSQNTVVALVAHPTRQAATTSREALQSDPAWKKAMADEEAKGHGMTQIVEKTESIFLSPTDYSPLK